MMLMLCMGLAFELPLVTWLLSLMGIVNKSFLRKYRRHAVVVIVIAAAIITPTGDPYLECCSYSSLSVVRNEYFDDKRQEEKDKQEV